MKRLLPILVLLPLPALAGICDFLALDQDGVSLAVALHNDDGINRKTDVTNATSGLSIDICPSTEACTNYAGAAILSGTAQTYSAPTTANDIRIAQYGTTGLYALHTRDEQWDAANARWAMVGISGVTGMMDYECLVYLDAADASLLAKEATLIVRTPPDHNDLAREVTVQSARGDITALEANLGDGMTKVHPAADSITAAAIAADAITGQELEVLGAAKMGSLLDTTVASVISQTEFVLTAGPAHDNAFIDVDSGIGNVVIAFDGSATNYPSIRRATGYVGSTTTLTINQPFDFTVVALDKIIIDKSVAGNLASVKADTMATLEDTAAILLDTGTEGVTVSPAGVAVILGTEVDSVGGITLKEFGCVASAVLFGKTVKGPGNERRHLSMATAQERLYSEVEPTTLERTAAVLNTIGC